MSKRAKWVAGILTFVAVMVITVTFVANKNHTDSEIDQQNDPKVTVSAGTTKKSSKADSDNKNLFLQEKANPDRYLAVHPFGSTGVYEFRKNSNGDLYPEHKFFNGTVSQKDGKLLISPINSDEKAKPFSLKENGKGGFTNTDSGEDYGNIKVIESNKNDQLHYSKGTIVTSNSQPVYSADYDGPVPEPSHDSTYEVDYQQFYNPYTKIYYGAGDAWKTFDQSTFDSKDHDNPDSIMHWKINRTTSPEQAAANETVDWQIAYHYPHQLN
jgi:hypothetical protein